MTKLTETEENFLSVAELADRLLTRTENVIMMIDDEIPNMSEEVADFACRVLLTLIGRDGQG